MREMKGSAEAPQTEAALHPNTLSSEDTLDGELGDSAVPPGLNRASEPYPGLSSRLSSWAKISRPGGTSFPNSPFSVLTRALKALLKDLETPFELKLLASLLAGFQQRCARSRGFFAA
jgi:hypothetical protein